MRKVSLSIVPGETIAVYVATSEEYRQLTRAERKQLERKPVLVEVSALNWNAVNVRARAYQLVSNQHIGLGEIHHALQHTLVIELFDSNHVHYSAARHNVVTGVFTDNNPTADMLVHPLCADGTLDVQWFPRAGASHVEVPASTPSLMLVGA